MPLPGNRQRVFVILVTAILVSGCAAQRAYKRGERAAERDEWDRAVAEFVRAKAIVPENHTYRVAVERARIKASQAHFKTGETHFLRGHVEDALAEFEQAVLLDPSNQYFFDELEKARGVIEKKRKHLDARRGELEELKDKVRREDPIVPTLDVRADTPVAFKFTETDVKEVYNALGKLAGINILLDEQIRDKKISIDLADVTFEQALDTLLLINQHYYKVIDEKSIIIIPDNQTKRRQYDELVIKTFYLSSADINEVQQLVQRLINTRFMSTSKQLNSITIRDTADKVAIAERIIDANDKSKAEVIIDVELLEINRRNFESLGTQLVPGYSVSQTLAQDEDGIQLSRLDKLTQNDWFLTFPSIQYNFLKQDSDTRLIAKPQIRVSEGEKANILIGDKVPIPTTTFNTNQTVGGNVVPITSFQYQDVGIKINLEPRVHHNKEVTLKLKVEVSQIIATNDAGQPTIGTRTIETVIRLREGETNLLAGLIREDQNAGKTGIPGLSDIPLLGKLFSQNSNDHRQTDLVLTLTPHIIRLPNIREEDLSPIYVGTEENTTLRKAPKRSSLFGGATSIEDVESGDGTETDGAGENGGGDGGDEMGDSAPPAEGTASPSREEGLGDPGAEGDGGSEAGGAAEEPPVRPTQPAIITIQPSSVEAPVDGTFSVDILMMQAANVGHVPFYVNFDPAVLSFVAAAEGDLLRQNGAQTQFMSNSPRPGVIIFGCSRMGATEGASGSGRVATLTFKGLATGQSAIGFSNNFVRDPNTAPLPSDWRGCQVTIK